jgi:hypothetical protein
VLTGRLANRVAVEKLRSILMKRPTQADTELAGVLRVQHDLDE